MLSSKQKNICVPSVQAYIFMHGKRGQRVLYMEHSVPLENVQNNSIEITAELNALKDRQ